jgi:hypothetical protein
VAAPATVEVLERADDPAKNLPGTIRREDVGGSRHLWQALVIPSDPKRTRWVCIHAPGSSLAVGKLRDHHEVERCPVVGEAFGTPAWEDKRGNQPSLSEHGEKREPRVFAADGPEPPHDVAVLRDGTTDHDDRGYLLRTEDGWCWSHRPQVIRADCGPIQSWKDAASSADGNLWEVLS